MSIIRLAFFVYAYNLAEATGAQVLDGKIKLIAWGMKDIAFREKELKHWIKYFPDVKVMHYAGAGHFMAEEKPEELIHELTEMMNFQ